MAATDTSRRPATLWLLLVLLLVQGLGGLAGGLSLALQPDGSIMQMPLSYLDGSPFSDYLIPGLILLLVLGVLPAGRGSRAVDAPALGLVRRRRRGLRTHDLDPRRDLRSIPFSWLQPAFGVVGVLIFAVAVLKSVRRYFGVLLPGEDAD